MALLLYIVFCILFSGSFGKLANRLENGQPLVNCIWTTSYYDNNSTASAKNNGGNYSTSSLFTNTNRTLKEDERRFECFSSAGKSIESSVVANNVRPSSITTNSFGGDELRPKSTRVNFYFRKSALTDPTADYSCLLIDYCMTGSSSHLLVAARFGDAGKARDIWSRKLKQADASECREVIQTVYDKTLPVAKPYESYNISVSAHLAGVPSSYHFERIALFSGPCRVRIEGDYYREYENHLSDNFSRVKSLFDYYLLKHDEPLSGNHMGYRWPHALIPYFYSSETVNSELVAKRTGVLKMAIKAVETVSCVRFVENESEMPTGYSVFLKISDLGHSCFTEEVGIRNRHVVMHLGEDCWQLEVLMHQMMHVLTFAHESNRPDRNFYVKIMKQNVASDKLFHFERHDDVDQLTTTLNLPYDYHTIMHFRSAEFSLPSTPLLANNSTPPNITRTLVAVEDETISLGDAGMAYTNSDIAKIRSLYCSRDYKCVVDDCPGDSVCFDSNIGCKCITQTNGTPGSCLALMEQTQLKNCGLSTLSFGRVLEVGENVPLCLCRGDGRFRVNDTCQYVKTSNKTEKISMLTKMNGNNSASEQLSNDIKFPLCPFGYRQLPPFNFSTFQCDPVPEVVQLDLLAASLLVPTNSGASESVVKLSGLSFREFASWPREFDNESSPLYLSALKIVRFEILRALSLIYLGDDSLLTKNSNFDVASTHQEPWINPFGSVKIRKSNSSENSPFGISVILYFTQPVYFDLAWLQLRLASLFGLDGAERENGFIFVRGKDMVTLHADVCNMFNRPLCPSSQICLRGLSIGNVTVCVTADKAGGLGDAVDDEISAAVAVATTTDTILSPDAGAETSPFFGLTVLEITLMAVSTLFAVFVIVCIAFLFLVTHRKGNNRDSSPYYGEDSRFDNGGGDEELEMSHRQSDVSAAAGGLYYRDGIPGTETASRSGTMATSENNKTPARSEIMERSPTPYDNKVIITSPSASPTLQAQHLEASRASTQYDNHAYSSTSTTGDDDEQPDDIYEPVAF